MKTTLRTLLVAFLLACTSLLSAQQVSTLYFLESAPMRHTINPSFQPTSKVYVTLPLIGYSSLWLGTNRWTVSDFLFKGPNGNTITPLHPDADGWGTGKPKWLAGDIDLNVNILGFGFRLKEKGYVHFNVSERLSVGVQATSSLLTINNIDTEKENIYSLSASALAYTDIAMGYSHIINDKWTVGGKLKILLGQVNIRAAIDELRFQSTVDELNLSAKGELYAAAPIPWEKIPTNDQNLGATLDNVELSDPNLSTMGNIMNLLKPAGGGVAFDLGMTYKPIKHLQVTASITDLGFICWNRHGKADLGFNTTYYGAEFDFANGGIGNVAGNITDSMGGLGLQTSGLRTSDLPIRCNMVSAKLNVGVDANFWDNRVGVGLYSRTQFYNSRVTEELTLGAAFRPTSWFQLAASYSLINGRGANIGAALNLAPYDGVMLTLAADYVPLSYAKLATPLFVAPVPYKTPGFNLGFGIAIVVGSNPKKEDKLIARDADQDGIINRLDLCPHTPMNVQVDQNGCPLDTDADGVPDYLDQCPYTPVEAAGMVDSLGCPLDADKDGVLDYLDKCPDTPLEAAGMVDSLGCPLDTDADSVPDYLDQCPNTPLEICGEVDSLGCPSDMDEDGVYDYMDRCPDTAPEARQHVDSLGCPLDTDEDGIYDYEDLCPTAPGVPATKGCPEVKSEVRNMLEKAMAAIQFDRGRATIKASSFEMLNTLADLFIENPEYKIEVQGHTDGLGQQDFNLDLSDRRAHSVRTYLVNKGVPASQLTARGYGSEAPIADNATKEGREMNSRVEFNISFDEIIKDTIEIK